MVKRILAIALIWMQLTPGASAQTVTPFDSLINVLEKKFPVTFYFDRKQTSGLSIPPSSGSLDEVLKTTLEGTGLTWYRDQQNRVYISRGNPLNATLAPDYFTAGAAGKKEASAAADLEVKPVTKADNKIYTIGNKGGAGSTAVISGYVREAKNGEPVNGASVTIEGSQGGVSTDAFGFYSITVPKGRQTLRVGVVGMKEIGRTMNVLGNGKMDMEMQEEIRSLKTAVIIGQKQSNVRGMQMGVDRLSIRAIKNIPAVLGETDILRSLQTLPGVTSVGEGTAGYNVRGGAADQNLVLLNDMTIYNPTHLFGFFSAVDAEIVRGLDLYKSAIPERLGGRISSIMDVSTRDGNTKKVTGTVGIGPLTSKFTVEGPLGSEKTTFLVGGRTTYSNWFLKYLPEAYNNSQVNFSDVMLHLSHEFSAKDRIYISGYFSNDKFRLNQDSTYSYSNKNFRFKWKHNFSDKFYNVLSAGMDVYDYSVKGRNNPKDYFDLTFGIKQTTIKSDFRYAPNNKHDLDFGVQHIIYDLNPGQLSAANPASVIAPKTVRPEQGTETSIYLGDQYRVTNKFTVQGGLRYSYYRYVGPGTTYIYADGQPRTESTVTDSVSFGNGKLMQHYQAPEVRVSARYLLSEKSSLKISYNTLYQYIHMITNSTAISPTDTWKMSDAYIKPQFGQQLSLGFYTQPGEKGDEFSIEAYYKTTKNYLDYKSGAQLLLNDHLERDVFATKGKAYGVEVMYKKPNGKLNGWVSYTYLRTFLRQNDPLAGETINKGEFYPASFDKPHIASVVANYKFTQRVSLSVTSSYSTGRPITYPVGVFTMGGADRVYYSERNAFRIPDFFRTDVSMIVDHNHKVTQKVHASWTFGIYNITGRDNPYSVYFVTSNRQIKGYQLSVFSTPIPFVTFNLKF
jgi:hypothetical protein